MTSNKIVTFKRLKRIVPNLKKQGKTIAFTNGCFDLLHFGHVQYLQKAKKNNRILIVGLNSDASIRKLKGPSRPLTKQAYRGKVLAALECVDFVTVFSGETPLRLIKSVKPDVLIKGADWKGKEVVGGKFVRSCGGKVELIHYVPNCSTTQMIKTIVKKCRKI